MQREALRVDRGPPRNAYGPSRAQAAHEGGHGDPSGGEAANVAVRDGGHRALPSAEVVGGKAAGRDVRGRYLPWEQISITFKARLAPAIGRS